MIIIVYLEETNIFYIHINQLIITEKRQKMSFEKNVEKAANALNKKNIKCTLFEDRLQLTEYIISETESALEIGVGGSITVKELGLYDLLSDKGKKVYWHWKEKPENIKEVLKKAAFSDVYLTSSNAITEEGRIINIDGRGNRVSAMVYGPKKVIIIAGKNKICKNNEDAIDRIKTIACPQNARRLKLNTPCAATGICNDCKSTDRMCNVISIIEGNVSGTEIQVCILNEDMGY